MLSKEGLENAISKDVIETGLTIPHDLNTPSHQNDIKTKLKLLMLATNSDYAFIYPFSSRVLTDYSNADDNGYDQALNIEGLVDYLDAQSNTIKTINQSLDNVFHTNENQLVCMQLQHGKEKVAIAGMILPALRPSKRRKNETVVNNLSTQQRQMAKLLFEDLKNYYIEKQTSQAREILHSQHLQLSSLNQDLIAIKDANHKLIYANPAYINSFPENERSNLLGRSNEHLFDSDTRENIIQSDLTALKKAMFVGTQTITLANGDEKVLQTTKKAFVGIDNKRYIMCVSRDVTEKEVLIDDLKRSNADLDNFAYVASHDLKAPLNAIKRLVTWVAEDCDAVLPQESKEDLNIVLSRVNRMEQLLNDLLSYSRIGKDYQESSEINLREFVVELLSLIDLPMGFVLNCDNVNIKVPLIPFNVVMLNLVSNAIKHHDSGNAKIEIKARSNSKGCTISIMDNGPGIDEKNRERVFKLFETLKPRDEVEGSGIGLSVVKKIIEFYGGNIKVESNSPRGAKFTFKWPHKHMARSVLNSLGN